MRNFFVALVEEVLERGKMFLLGDEYLPRNGEDQIKYAYDIKESLPIEFINEVFHLLSISLVSFYSLLDNNSFA